MRRYAFSYLIALVLTILLGVVAGLTDSVIGALLLPGMLLAAIPFREGIHSSHPMVWFVLTGFMEAFVLSWLVMLVWTLVMRSRRTNRTQSEPGNVV
jgi:hypothetical protein